jgi:hypothetical protein
MMVFGHVRETHEIRRSQLSELHEIKNALGQRIASKWRAGGIMLVSKKRTEFGPAHMATVDYFSSSVIFGSNQVDEMRCLGNLWLQECERWRALIQNWNAETQDALIYGQESVNRRRGNRIVGAFLSINGDKVEVSVRKTMLPMEELGEDLLALS